MTKSRKRMLLSSIAMLLVALVALGSATYAWFTINKEVTAEKITVKAIVASGLEITGDNGTNWGRKAEFNDATTGVELKPVSLNTTSALTNGTTKAYVANDVSKTNGGAWATGETAIKGFVERDLPTPLATAASANPVKKNDGFFAAYRIGIKSSGGEISGKKVQVKVEATDATVDDDDKIDDPTTFVKAVLLDGNIAGNVKYKYGDEYSAITSTQPTVADVAAGNTGFVDLQNSINGTATYYTLLVWYEGNDQHCVDAGQLGVADFKVTFQLADAS